MRRPLAALALLLVLAPGAAAAQPRLSIAGPRTAIERRELGPFHVLFGVPAAQRLLKDDDARTRIRGVERLGSLGTPEAIDALVDAMDPSSAIARDPRASLTAVRVLAGESKRENVRRLLTRLVTDASGSDGRGAVSPLSWMVRSTAALALARGGDKDGVGALVAALIQGGAPAEAATRALRVYPPASLEPFLEGRQRLTPALAAFLGELGDLRAAPRLRAMLEETDTAGQTAAVVALAKLGDDAALAPARAWLKRPEPRLRRAAAEALAYLDAPEAPAAIGALLDSEATLDDGLRLALAAPSPPLAAALAKLLAFHGGATSGPTPQAPAEPSLPDDDRPRAVAAMGRAGAVAPLAALLETSESATGAAFALATLPGDEARGAIERALAVDLGKRGEGRRLLLRAGTVRALVLDDAPAGLRAGLRASLEEKGAADRAVGAFGLVATGALSLGDAIDRACKGASCDAALLGAAARGALALPDGASSLEPLLPLLARAATEDMGEALTAAVGAVLLAHPDGGTISTSALAAWAEAGGPLAPLAARALPSRDDEALRGRIVRLLEGTDPVVRAHVALGLGRDPEPSSVSLLTGAYRFEEDPLVRRAVVRALSGRAEPQREATLAMARDLDPDDEVRSLARAALAGRALDPALRPALGVEPRRSVAWVTIRPTEGGTAGKARAARVVCSDGLAVPAVADPDGVLLVPGLPPGVASLSLGSPPAPPPPAGAAP